MPVIYDGLQFLQLHPQIWINAMIWQCQLLVGVSLICMQTMYGQAKINDQIKHRAQMHSFSVVNIIPGSNATVSYPSLCQPCSVCHGIHLAEMLPWLRPVHV